jgi:cyanophycin synthetase
VSEEAPASNNFDSDVYLAPVLSRLARFVEQTTKPADVQNRIDYEVSLQEDVVVYPFDDEFSTLKLLLSCYYFLVQNCAEAAANSTDCAKLLPRLHDLVEKIRSHPTPELARATIEIARRNRIPVKRIGKRFNGLVFGYGCNQRILWRCFSDSTSHIGTFISTNKSIANEILRRCGLPAPRQEAVLNLEAAKAAAAKIGYPVVVKPQSTDHGLAVTTNIGNDAELAVAFEAAAAHGAVVIEKQIPGFDYRILVINGVAERIYRRVPAHVLGDAVSTISQLIQQATEARKLNRENRDYPFVDAKDPQVAACLAEQRLRLSDVPGRGQHVYLRKNANVSTGGTTENAINVTHPDNLRLAERAALALSLDIAGVDFISPDISLSWLDVECGICEVNPTPGLPYEEDPLRIMNYFTRNGTDNLRIPIVVLVAPQAKAASLIELFRASPAAAKLAISSVDQGTLFENGYRIAPSNIGVQRAIEIALYNKTTQFLFVCFPDVRVNLDDLGIDYADLAILWDATVGGENFAQLLRRSASCEKVLLEPEIGFAADACSHLVTGP